MELGEEVRAFLEDATFVTLCLPVDLGRGEEAIVVVKASGEVLEGLRDAGADVAVGWVVEDTARGPVACLVVRATAPGLGELDGEAYFDVGDQGDWNLLGLLRRRFLACRGRAGGSYAGGGRLRCRRRNGLFTLSGG